MYVSQLLPNPPAVTHTHTHTHTPPPVTHTHTHTHGKAGGPERKGTGEKESDQLDFRAESHL